MDPQLTDLGIRLTELAARGTAASVATRIRTARVAKQDREALSELEDIIAELSEDRSELLQIAQAYREQVAAQTISTDEVNYITSELIPKVTQIFELVGGSTGIDAETQAAIDAVKALVSVETLTILQLLGFSFKRAVGEPLTELVARIIRARTPDVDMVLLQQKVVERDLQLAALAQNADAFERFLSLRG